MTQRKLLYNTYYSYTQIFVFSMQLSMCDSWAFPPSASFFGSSHFFECSFILHFTPYLVNNYFYLFYLFALFSTFLPLYLLRPCVSYVKNPVFIPFFLSIRFFRLFLFFVLFPFLFYYFIIFFSILNYHKIKRYIF